MNNYNIKSKVYVVPSLAPLIGYIVVNCFIVFLMIWVVVDIFKNGLEFRDTLLILLSLGSLIAMKMTKYYRPHYETSLASLTLDERRIEVEFPKHNRSVTFYPSSIVSLEYSDKINCLRIVGDYTYTNSKKTTSMNGEEYLLYASVPELGLFKDKLESITGRSIIFVDRK